MAAPIRELYPEAIYHVVSRGNNRGWIVRDALDRAGFRMRLNDVAIDYDWEVFAWCLMTNHQHIVLRAPDGCISRGMQELNSRHALAMNRRHGRCGHLYQNRFFSREVASDSHFIASTAYVNRNPVAAFVVEHAADWRDSSYRATIGLDRAPEWLGVDFVLAVLGRTPVRARENLDRLVHFGGIPASEVLDDVRRYERTAHELAA